MRRTASTAPGMVGAPFGVVALDDAIDDGPLDLGLGQVEVQALAHRARPGGRVGAHDRGPVGLGPGPAVRGREGVADLVPPDLGVDEDAVEVEDDRAVQLSVPSPAAAAWCRPCAVVRRRPSRAAPRPPARRGHGSAVGGREQSQRERRDRVGIVVRAVQDLALDLEASRRRWPPTISTASSPSWTRLQRTSLPRGARPLPRDVDPDVDLEETGIRRHEHEVADGGIVAPHDPALRIGLGSRASRARAR